MAEGRLVVPMPNFWNGQRRTREDSCMLCIVLVNLIGPSSMLIAVTTYKPSSSGTWLETSPKVNISYFSIILLSLFYTECFGMKRIRGMF